MSDDREGITTGSRAIQHILLFSLIILLPGLQNSIFGWMHFIIPLAVFFYLYKWRNGLRFVLAGLVIATIASIMLKSFATLIFSVTLIPAGYILAQSAFQSDSPALSGLKATLTLGASWLLLFIGLIAVTNVNPITDFLSSLDHGLEEALAYYRHSGSITPETMALLEQSFEQMKSVLPKVIPSVLFGLALVIIWFTMLAGNRLIKKVTGYRPWPDHRTWQLPEKLIWALIATALLSLLPLGNLRIFGINALIAFSFMYFFQGFSILVFFLHKWRVPLLFRAFFLRHDAFSVIWHHTATGCWNRRCLV